MAPPSPPRCPPGSAQSPALGPASASAHQSLAKRLGIAASAGGEQHPACSAPKKHLPQDRGGLGAAPVLVAPHRGGLGGWRCCCELSVCLGQQLPEPEQAPGVCFLLADSFLLPELQPSRASGLAADPLVGAVPPSLPHAARGLLVVLGSSFTPLCLPQQPWPSPSLCSRLPVGVLCFPPPIFPPLGCPGGSAGLGNRLSAACTERHRANPARAQPCSTSQRPRPRDGEGFQPLSLLLHQQQPSSSRAALGGAETLQPQPQLPQPSAAASPLCRPEPNLPQFALTRSSSPRAGLLSSAAGCQLPCHALHRSGLWLPYQGSELQN